jgi:hypothetical protein
LPLALASGQRDNHWWAFSPNQEKTISDSALSQKEPRNNLCFGLKPGILFTSHPPAKAGGNLKIHEPNSN